MTSVLILSELTTLNHPLVFTLIVRKVFLIFRVSSWCFWKPETYLLRSKITLTGKVVKLLANVWHSLKHGKCRGINVVQVCKGNTTMCQNIDIALYSAIMPRVQHQRMLKSIQLPGQNWTICASKLNVILRAEETTSAYAILLLVQWNVTKNSSWG